jgi:predicted nucleic-acid-binding Zn-ribbon protein
MTKKKCLRCGGENLTPGKVQSSGRMCFYPENTKFMTLKTSDVPVGANLCLDCGFIEFIGDVKKAKDLTSQKGTY